MLHGTLSSTMLHNCRPNEPYVCFHYNQVVFLHNVHIRVSLLDKAPISGDVSQARAQPDLDMSANALLQAIHSNSFVISDLGPQGQVPVKLLTTGTGLKLLDHRDRD